MGRMEKLFLSIGAMKAGTTWLYSLLERHPQINFTPEKEIHFLAHNYLDKKYLTEDHRRHRAQTRLHNIGTSDLNARNSSVPDATINT